MFTVYCLMDPCGLTSNKDDDDDCCLHFAVATARQNYCFSITYQQFLSLIQKLLKFFLQVHSQRRQTVVNGWEVGLLEPRRFRVPNNCA